MSRGTGDEKATPWRRGDIMRVVVMCCLCEKVFDDMDKEPSGTRWKDHKWYMAQYQLKSAETRIARAYCPKCLESYRRFLKLPSGNRRASEKEEKA
jgi:hypothetical protein